MHRTPSIPILLILLILSVNSLAQDGAVEISATPEGGQAAIDLAEVAGLPRVAAAPWWRKPDVAVTESAKATWRGVSAHPWRTVFGVVGAAAGIRAAQGELDDDLKGIAAALGLRDDSSSSSRERSPEIPVPPEHGNVTIVRDNEAEVNVKYDVGENGAAGNTTVIEGNTAPVNVEYTQPSE